MIDPPAFFNNINKSDTILSGIISENQRMR